MNYDRGFTVHFHYLDDSCFKAAGVVTWCEF